MPKEAARAYRQYYASRSDQTGEVATNNAQNGNNKQQEQTDKTHNIMSAEMTKKRENSKSSRDI